MQSDQDYNRRKFSRPSHDHETVGPIRFFKTVADMYGDYPEDGVAYYAQMLRDVTFAKENGAVVSFVATEFFDWIGNLAGGQIPLGSIAPCTKIGARWWTGAAEINTHGTGIGSNRSDCVYPGQDVGSNCFICSCTADPWVTDPGKIICGEASVGGPRALFLQDGDNTCIWETDEFTSAERTFYWKLTVSVDLSAELRLLETTGGGDPVTLAVWTCDKFCCVCARCFELDCSGLYFPVPCANLPDEICLATPHFGIATITACSDCQDRTSTYYEFMITGTGTQTPAGEAGDAFCCNFDGTWWPLQYFPNFTVGGDPTQHHCAWTFGAVTCSNDSFGPTGWMFITCGDPDGDGTFTISIALVIVYGGFISENTVYDVTTDSDSWDFESEITLNFNRTNDPSCNWPESVTLRAKEVVTDPSGIPVKDADGKPVIPPSHTPCDPNGKRCCFELENISGVYQYLNINGGAAPGEGTFAECEALIDSLPPPSDFFPDPGDGFLAGTVCFRNGEVILIEGP